MLRSLGWLLLAGASTSVLAAAKIPQPVSPGTTERVDAVEARCPTFQWAGIPGARGYELAVFQISDDRAEPTLVTRATVPGDARGFTPSVGDCLDRGGRYAWSVAATTTGGELRWSSPLLFAVRAGPSLEELDHASATIDEYRDHALPGSLTAQSSGSSSIVRVASAASPSLGNPSLRVSANIALGTASNFFKDGDTFLWDDTDGNTALGRKALVSAGANETSNTAVGRDAMRDNPGGAYAHLRDHNTAIGDGALIRSAGQNTTAIGHRALYEATGTLFDTAVGFQALYNSKFVARNTAIGDQALYSWTYHHFDTAIGYQALFSGTSGLNNTAVGTRAGSNVNNGGGGGPRNDNIFLGSGACGEATDNKTIRVGGTTCDEEEEVADGHQTRTFIGGIFCPPGPITGCLSVLEGGIAVVIDENGQLGTISSSRSVKQDIEDLGPLVDSLLELRPVAFRYKQHAATDPDSPLQFGLIAEEVAEVLPELVVYDQDGKPMAVHYEFLDSLLLGALEKRQAELSDQRELAAKREAELAKQRDDLERLEARLEAVESRARSGDR